MIASQSAPDAGPVEHRLCGDGTKQSEATCDDGNREAWDGCDASCLLEKDWSLQVNGALTPAFDPAVTEYAVQLPLFVEKLTVGATAPDGVRLAIADYDLTALGDWTSPKLEYGNTTIGLSVTVAGDEKQTFHFDVHRDTPVEQYLKASHPEESDGLGTSMALTPVLVQRAARAASVPELSEAPAQPSPSVNTLPSASASAVPPLGNTVHGHKKITSVKRASAGPGSAGAADATPRLSSSFARVPDALTDDRR